MAECTLDTFVQKIVGTTSDGKEKEEREAIVAFDFPRHGVSIEVIKKYLSVDKESRENAQTRVLGFKDFKNKKLTQIAKVFLLKCSDKQAIIRNQFKKWHFPAPLNRSEAASEFDVFPYWITLEFLLLAKTYNIEKVTFHDFLIFISTIKHRDHLNEHLTVYNEYCKLAENEKLNFVKKLPEKTLERFDKGYFAKIFTNNYFKYIESGDNSIFLSENLDTELIGKQIETFYSAFKFTTEDIGLNSAEYLQFLQSEISMSDIFEPSRQDMSMEKIKEISGMLNRDFKNYNLLLKGVPGTGKSRLFDMIIKNKIFACKSDDGSEECLAECLIEHNVIRINIHSELSNAELMHGISVSTDSNNIIYKEKQGLILNHIAKAILNPSLPYVVILEEVQENSLNLLIGDLIYLIEPSKRVKFKDDYKLANNEENFILASKLTEEIAGINKIIVPNLVSSAANKYLCIPENIFIFCTSNYRDDKKVIEDNLLRRFDVLEVYPHYDGFKSTSIANFLSMLNKAIVGIFSKEIHPDRFQIGHANWINIEEKDEIAFYYSLLKVAIEFKEIKEIPYESGIGRIFKELWKQQVDVQDWVKVAFEKVFNKNSYQELINVLQAEVYGDILSLTKEAGEPIESDRGKSGDEAKQASLV